MDKNFSFAALAVRLLALTLSSLISSGCGDPGCTTTLAPDPSADANHTNIQNALSAAKPADTICFAPGRYSLHDELSLSVDNVTMRSTHDGLATLDFTGQTHGANGLSVVSVKKFTLESINVSNTPGDGVRVTQSDDVTFRNVTVTWDAGAMTANGAYGLYPVQCNRVLITRIIERADFVAQRSPDI